MQIICVHRYQIQWAAFQWCPVYITPGVPKVQRGGGGGKKKKNPPNLQKLSHYTNMTCFISFFAKIIPWHSRDAENIAPEVPKVQWGGGGVKIPQSYCTMIKCSLYICFIKKIILHAFFLRCPGYIAPEVPNIEKKLPLSWCTKSCSLYKYYRQYQLLQKNIPKVPRVHV